LFGDYNPAGRLPVTFYKSDADLPHFEDYSMENRTYRYFKGTPLYPFGYGLSYTQFEYSNLEVPITVKVGTTIPVKVTVTNKGSRSGEEVAQLYIAYTDQKIKVPIRALRGFNRIELNAGESKTLHFHLNAEDLMVTGEDGKSLQPKGKLLISVGGGQPDVKIKTTS